MDSLEAAPKRWRPDPNGGVAGLKRTKDAESIQSGSGLGSKSKTCTKFFSTSGCLYGEGCHFLHFVRGGVNPFPQMTAAAPPRRNPMAPPTIPDAPSVKTRVCNSYNTAEGCRFGEKCHFIHGERELGKPVLPSHHDHHHTAPPTGGRLPGLPPGADPAASFGASATVKISVDASLAGAIIGKGGVNTKQINRLTGARLFVREHESDANLRNIELEGTFDQIKQASTLFKELMVCIGSSLPLHLNPTAASAAPCVYYKNPAAASAVAPGVYYKTKLCEKFAKGMCTFGDRCHFAHWASELRNAAA